MRKHTIKRTAYHEAGHVIASFHCHIPFKSVEIYDPDILSKLPRRRLPSKNLAWLYGNELKLIGRVVALKKKQRICGEVFFLISLAGAASEYLRYGNKNKCLVKNLYEILAIVNKVGDDGLDFLFECTLAMLRQPAFFNATERLAGELIVRRKIPYKKAMQIIEDSLRADGVELS